MIRTVTLLTDFGTRDPYVAEVKGRMHAEWRRYPRLRPPAIVDLSHELPPGDVAAAAWFLERAHAAWPAGTLHLAVVDPGVGGERPALAASARGQLFVGPGNGLLAFLQRDDPPPRVVVLDNPLYHRGPGPGPGPQPAPAVGGRPAPTFHGRDIFAPAAAHLAAGVPLAQVGSAGAPELLGPRPAPPAGAGEARIVWIDRFGNAISDLHREGPAGRILQAGGTVRAGALAARGPLASYASALPGTPFWYWGSGETLEIALRGASAADRWGLRSGMALCWEAP